SLDRSVVNHVAIVDMLPSGLEPILESVEVASESGESYEGNMPGKRKKKHHRADEEVMEGESEGDDMPPPPPPPMEGEGESGDEGALYNFFRLFLPEAMAEDAAKAVHTGIEALSPQYVDRREDRLVIYAEADPDIHEFIYRAKAVAKGKFVVPPAFAESMYDRDAQYRGLANAFTVEAQ
ncbi:MAG: alpha-2-macroglobulin family protein, partial [Bdellovibrionales bacterium]